VELTPFLLDELSDPDTRERLNKAADLIDASKRILASQVPQSTDSGRLVSGNLPWLLNLETAVDRYVQSSTH
jgi:hypothetical protein